MNDEIKNKFTMIRLEKITVGKLKQMKLAKLETYDEIINRMIKVDKNEIENKNA